jgi:hypothetical protein
LNGLINQVFYAHAVTLIAQLPIAKK